MRDDKRRVMLAGATRHEPPRVLRERSPFGDEAGYRGFLAAALEDKDGFWLAEARKLSWVAKPAAACESGEWFAGGRLDPVGAILERFARADPAAAVLADGAGLAIPAADLPRAVFALCEKLAASGLEPGSRVLLALPRGPKLVLALLACLRQGLVAVPVNPAAGDAGQAGRRSRAAGCSGAVVAAMDAAADLPAEAVVVLEGVPLASGGEPPPAVHVGAGHPGAVFFDSAGRPYSIPLGGLLVQAVSAIERMLLVAPDRGGRLWLETPAHHASFLAAALGALLSGIELVVPGPAALASPFEQLRQVAASGADAALIHGPLLPPRDPAAAEGEVDPGRLQLVILEGDSVGPGAFGFLRDEVLRGAVHVTGAVARPEVGGFVAGSDPGALAALPGCAGAALPGFDLVVLDQRGRPCEAGLGGFAALARPVPGLALELSGQQCPVTLGLRARVDREGRLWPMGEGEVDRPEVEHVSATEIEALVAGIDGIDQVAVVHYIDAGGATRAVMYIETAAGEAAATAVREAIVEQFGSQAVPGSIRTVARLPITRSGKLLRSVLRRVAAGEMDGLEQVCDPQTIAGLIDLGAGREKEGSR